jgi:hypothetical protein
MIKREDASLAVVPDDVGTTFAGKNEVFPAVVVEVRYANLQADSRPLTSSCGRY